MTTFSNSMMNKGDSRIVNGNIMRTWMVFLGMATGLNHPRFSTAYLCNGQTDLI